MKTTSLFFIGLMISISAFGQAETANSKKIADAFEEHYNAGDYEAIYNLYSSSMKEALSQYKTQNFLSGLKSFE